MNILHSTNRTANCHLSEAYLFLMFVFSPSYVPVC